MKIDKGLIVIPTDETYVEGTKKYIRLFKADAIRDCDGVKLPSDLKQFDCLVYKSYFIVREDHEYALKHPEYLQNVLLMSPRKTALDDNKLEINLLEGIFDKSISVNGYEYKKYWQVIDRTSGKEHHDYSFDGHNTVIIHNPIRFHEYTVNFFGVNTWDAVQIYNYHSNHWKDVPIDMDLDPIYPEALKHMLSRFETFLKENEDVDVIRFTTFFYNFFIIFKDGFTQTSWDWYIYNFTASPMMFDLFEKECGYQIKAEDLINGGNMANRFVIPNKAMSDYIDLVQRKCAEWAKLFVDLAHKYNKKTLMFDGDHRIGVEPYSKYFDSIGIDMVVGAPNDLVYYRQLSDSNAPKKEIRMNPYFFPNELLSDDYGVDAINYGFNQIKQGLLINPIERIGFGGYLKQLDGYPKFVKRVSEICDEFRTIKSEIGENKAKSFLTVGVISTNGRYDSWSINSPHVSYLPKEAMQFSAVLPALAALPIDVKFISFEDVINGKLDGIDVLMNFGLYGTSFHGGDIWKNDKLITSIKEFVYNGGGLIGFDRISECPYEGKNIQLGEVFGIEKESGLTLFNRRLFDKDMDKHFLIDDVDMNDIYFNNIVNSVYPTSSLVLKSHYMPFSSPNSFNNINVDLAVNEYGKGRAVYFSSLFQSFNSKKLIYNALLYAAKKENLAKCCVTDSVFVDCYYYENENKYSLINTSDKDVSTSYYDIDSKKHEVALKAHEVIFVK